MTKWLKIIGTTLAVFFLIFLAAVLADGLWNIDSQAWLKNILIMVNIFAIILYYSKGKE